MIAAALDGDLQSLAGSSSSGHSSGRLVWMPAHQTLAAVGERKLSSGQRLSHVDWRANRLVDALAKISAGEVSAMDSVRKLLDSAAAAAKHAAMLLGRVTHAANNHLVEVVGEDGCTSMRKVRDAIDAPRTSRQPRPAPGTPAKPAQSATPAIAARAIRALPRSRGASRSMPPLGRAARQRAADSAHTMRRVAEIGASLGATVGGTPASDRLDALRRQVVARSSAPAGVPSQPAG